MSSQLTADWVERRSDDVAAILARYPRKKSAIMPLLYLAQEERGYVADVDIEAIAEITGVSKGYAESVCSFYSLYHRKPVGKYVITICANMTCQLAGASDAVAYFEQKLGIRVGETTPDGLITLTTTGECIAACDGAPAAQVNLEYCNRMTPERIDGIIEMIRQGKRPEEISDAFCECSLRPTAGFVPSTPAKAAESQETAG